LVRTRVDEVSLMSRNTQGVTLIRVSGGEKLVGVARVEEPEDLPGEVVREASEESDEPDEGDQEPEVS
ncbi:MAG: DNA gyrase C-terminal beta-propeller domain-containing protein, partial [Endozoicomonas sp.]